MTALRIALVGDYDPAVLAHQAIPRAIHLASAAVGRIAQGHWLHTSALGAAPAARLETFDAVWLVPASPYADTEAALAAVRFAREHARPFLGTCGGFQHALLEYAEAVWRLDNVSHAELEPGAADPVIAALSCALVEQSGWIRFAPDSRLAMLYRADHALEGYHCRYGLNLRYAPRLQTGPLRATGWDEEGDVRAVELAAHPFFVATLFQPERSALRGQLPPVVRGLVEAAARATHRATP